MRRIILILLFLLIALPTDARMTAPMMCGGVAVAASSFCTGYSGLFCDDFEGSSTCGDDAASQANCINASAWSVVAGGAGGTVTNQATGLAGDFGKKLDATSHASAYHSVTASFTATNPVHMFVLFKIDTLTVAAGEGSWIAGISSGTTNVARLDVVNSSGIKFRGLTTETNLALTGAPTPTQGTTYCAWLYYNSNSGTGTEFRVETATCADGVCTCTKPTESQATISTGTGTADNFKLSTADHANTDSDAVTFDNVKISASAIGNNGN